MVIQDHFDDPGTESDGGGGGGGSIAGRGSAPESTHSVRLPSTVRDTSSARNAQALAALQRTPSLDRARGTALPPSEFDTADSASAHDEDSNLAYPVNSRHATDSGAAATDARATESSGGAVNTGTAAAVTVPAAEITSDADESDADDVPPARRSISQPSRKKKMRRDGGFLPAAKGFSTYNPDDYEQKYPPDNHVLEAMGPNARIWRVYLDEATLRDNDVIEGWRDTTDVLLVFAGLFSAVVTTLVVQSSQSLQPDNSQATVILLSELIDVQRAVGLGMSPDTVPRSQQLPAIGPVNSDLWVNGLWFVSLALSLATALMAMLVKQWIQYYVHPVAGTIQRRVQTTHFRFIGLQKWHVPAIIEFLPIVMHLALLLFFIGLVIFIKGLDNGITIWVAIIVGISYLIYLGTNLLPFYNIDCPYKTPMGDYIMKLGLFIWRYGQKLRVYLETLFTYIYKPMSAVDHDERNTTSILENEALTDQSTVTIGWRVLEQKSIQPSDAYVLDVKSLFWLYNYSANPTVSDLILQALPGADFFRHDLTVFGKADNVHDTIEINLKKYWDQKDQKEIEKWLWPWIITYMTNSVDIFPWYFHNPIMNYKTGPLDQQLKGFLECLSYNINVSKILQCISSLKLQASSSTFDLYINFITLYLKSQVSDKKDFYGREIGFIYLSNLIGLTLPKTLEENSIMKFLNKPKNINIRKNLTLLKGCANLMFSYEHESHIHINFNNSTDIIQVHSILCKILSKYLSESNFMEYCNPHNQKIFFNLCAYVYHYYGPNINIDIRTSVQMFTSQFISFVKNIEFAIVPAWLTCGIILKASISALSCLINTSKIHPTSFEGKLIDKKFIHNWFYIFEQALVQNPELKSLENVLYHDCLSQLLDFILDVNLYNTELISVLCSLDIDILGRVVSFFQMDTTNESVEVDVVTYCLYTNLKKIYDAILLSPNNDCLQEQLKYIQKNDNVQLYCKLFMALWKFDIENNYLTKALLYFDECIVKFISITSENSVWIEILGQLKNSIEEGTFSKAWFSNDVCIWFNKLRHAANLDSKIDDMNVEYSGRLMFLEAELDHYYYNARQAWINEIKRYYQTSSHKNEVVPAKRPCGIFKKYFGKTKQSDAESQT